MSPVCRLAAIQMPDVVGYSRLMGMDEVATLQAHPCEVVDPAIVVLKSGRTANAVVMTKSSVSTPQLSGDHHRA
jgi:hypothetical protein